MRGMSVSERFGSWNLSRPTHELRNSRVDVIARNAYISVMRSPCRATVAAACTATQWHPHAWGNRPAVRVTQFLTGFQETPIPRSRDVAKGKRTFSPGSHSRHSEIIGRAVRYNRSDKTKIRYYYKSLNGLFTQQRVIKTYTSTQVF